MLGEEVDEFGEKRVKTEMDSVKEEHERLFKAASNPQRRKIVAAIGINGATKEEVGEATGIDGFLLGYHLDVLLKGEFVRMDDNGRYRLTDGNSDSPACLKSNAF